MKPKSKPNRLMVEEAVTDDNSVVTMSPVSFSSEKKFLFFYEKESSFFKADFFFTIFEILAQKEMYIY